MKRHIQLEPLRIQQLDLAHWSIPVHSHEFYELVIITKGKGYHMINGNKFAYSASDIFMLGPGDHHAFTINEPTSFCLISFTESYLISLSAGKSAMWKQVKNYSLHTTLGFTGNLVVDKTDQLHLTALFSILISEYSGATTPSFSVTESIMSAILSLIERQVSHLRPTKVSPCLYSADIVQQVIAYISQHITDPERLRIEQLADIFNYSPGHLSALFKQQVGESLQQYIIHYRLKLVEKRLRLSSLTVSQIADEFGFTDICHLNKLFKRYYQHTPMVYRRDLVTS